jgi:hypothetical protein
MTYGILLQSHILDIDGETAMTYVILLQSHILDIDGKQP